MIPLWTYATRGPVTSRATFLAMQEALRELQAQPELILIDGNQLPPTLKTLAWAIPAGDQRSFLISCASIVAKVCRDELMRFYHRLFPDYRFDVHKGYGTPQHLSSLQDCGPSFLHRLSFRPVVECLPSEGLWRNRGVGVEKE